MTDQQGADGHLLTLLDELIGAAVKAGAEAADAVAFASASLSASCHRGTVEDVERAESRDIGLRVLLGRRQAVVSSTDDSPAALAELVERALAMAKAAPEDPYCGLAAPEALAKAPPALDLDDAVEPAPETLIERAVTLDESARAVPGVAMADGAEAGWSRTRIALAASNGFAGAYATSSHSLGVEAIVGEGTAMERDYDYVGARHGADLEAPEAVGRRAGERAVRRLGARQVPTAAVPVVYEPRVAAGLLRHLAMAISGPAVARGTSFLKSRMGTQVFAAGIRIVDDPHRRRGLSSKPFDGEGVANGRREIVADGVLASWLLDTSSGRQLELPSTGHAARGTSAPPSPSPTNLYLEAGARSPEALIADIPRGLYVTELSGFGVNPVTGDYSRGAAGLWIENGALAYPVSEVTVAGNLLDMYLALEPASDLEFRYGINAPTVRVDGMTVGGGA